MQTSNKLQELYVTKIKIYETIIEYIKINNFEALIDFENEFKQLELIDIKIKTDPELLTQRIMQFKL